MADVHELRASVVKALAHPVRIRIVELLAERGDMCICDIVNTVGVSQPTVSKHVAVLKNAGLIKTKREGNMVICHLQTPCALEFLKCIDETLIADADSIKRELERKMV